MSPSAGILSKQCHVRFLNSRPFCSAGTARLSGPEASSPQPLRHPEISRLSVLRPSGRIVESTNCYLDAAVNAEFRKRWIPDTVVALDDLDFSWLHWPNPKRLGDVVLYTNNCWVIRFKNPDASAEIRSKRVWILKERRKILKIGSYDEAGRELQSLTVRKMQRSEMNHWVFSEVNLMKWDPKTQKETGSVFEFESAEK